MPTTQRRAGALALVAVIVTLVAACGGGRDATPEPSLEIIPAPSLPVTGEVPPTVMDAARADLATIVGAEAAAVATVATAEAVEWPDSSLGCPQPDMMYAQVITPGYQVVFEIDGELYDYRATAKGGVMLCEQGSSGGG